MSSAPAYNEAFDDSGNLREPYRAFCARTRVDPLRPSAESAAALLGGARGVPRPIFPVPLILDDREYCDTIAPGVRQRALALQRLFHDLLGEAPEVYRQTSLPRDLFSRIQRQEGQDSGNVARWWEGRSREAVRFTYAPDLVRAPDGRWYVLEDNVGCVGGVVDAHLVARRFLAHTGTELHPRVPTGSDLADAVRSFLARFGATTRSDGVVALIDDECANADPEAGRKRQTLDELGVLVLNRAELKRRGVASHHVRAVINFDTGGWPVSLDPGERPLSSPDVPLMTAPGVAVLGNKALLPFIDEIVAVYSGAEPILRTAPTELCRALPSDPTDWVLKPTNGCQGTEVLFLDEMSETERARLRATMSACRDAGCAVLQRRVSASFLPEAQTSQRYQVELRPLGFVIGDSTCLVGQHVCGRAFIAAAGRRLGNISRGAHYLSVIREPAPSDRRRLAPQTGWGVSPAAL